MVVKGESPRSGAKMPDADSYGGAGRFFNLARKCGTSGVGKCRDDLWENYEYQRNSAITDAPVSRAHRPCINGFGVVAAIDC